MNIVYPKVKHKLPELFEEIIKVDDLLDKIKSAKVICIKDYISNKQTRQDYIRAAEQYIKRLKSSD